MCNRLVQYITLSIFLPALFSGCVKEQIGECTPGVKLKINYTPNVTYSSEFSQATVYVFDSEGLFYGSYYDNNENLTGDYHMTLPLIAGNYTAVVWGGDLSTYDVGEITDLQTNDFQRGLRKGVSTLEQFRLLIDYYSPGSRVADNNIEIRDLNDLYFANTTTIVARSDKVTYDTVDMVKDTHRIKMIVKGVDNLANPDLDVYCNATNGRLDWENNLDVNARLIKYIPYSVTNDAVELVADMKVLRLVKDNPVILKVINNNSGAALFDYNVIELILKNPKYQTQKDIDSQEEFVFEIEIQRNLTVVVTVNGWKVVGIDPIV